MNAFGGSKETAHIYLDDSWLKIACVRPVAGRPTVVALYRKNLMGMPDSSVPQEIRSGLQSMGCRARQVHVLLGSKYIITKNIEVPSLDPKEIEDIVRLQAVRHTPYSKEEVAVGHINLEVLLERYTKALLVIASNENIRKKTDLVEIAGYDVGSVRLASEALSRSVAEALSLAADHAPLGFVYVDAHVTDLVILSHRKPYFIRSIPIGATHLKQDSQANVPQLVEELKKTCDAYQSEDAAQLPQRFVFVGLERAEQTLLAKGFEAHLKLPCESVPVISKLSFSEEAKKTASESNDVSFLDVAADGLFSSEIEVDLIPEDLKIKRAFRAKGQEIFMVGAYVMVIFILGMGIFLTKIYFRNIYLGEIRKNFEIKKKEAEDLVLLSEQTRHIKEFSRKKGRALRVLNELQTVLPQEMYLSEISLGQDEKISIKGTSDLMSGVFAFVTEFENNPYFRSVSPDYTKSRKENDKDVSDFGLSANFEDPNDPYIPEPPKKEAEPPKEVGKDEKAEKKQDKDAKDTGEAKKK